MEEKFNQILEVDAKNLPCPLPLLKTKRALNLAEDRKKIIVLCSDINSKKDISSLCKKLKLPLKIIEKSGFFEIHIIKTQLKT